jgi:hypothetical protein
MLIEGKVAEILNERELVINRGADAGVKEGMTFKVVESKLDITDPDTGEVLGTISREKIRVRIAEVQSKFCIGRTYETYTAYVEPPVKLPPLPPLPRLPVTKVRTLPVSDPSGYKFSDFLRPDYVKVGDQAILVANEG